MSEPQAVSPRKQELINAELQKRFLEPQLRNLGFGSVIVAAVAAFLWPHADHQGLLIWVGLVVVTLIPITLMNYWNPPFRTFYWTTVGLELLSGVAWASGALLAMPRTTIWQSVLLMLFMGVLMSGASNMAQFFGVFLAFHLPLAIAVSVGFLIDGSWPAGPFLTIWALGLGYVGAAAFEAQQTQSALVRGNIDLAELNELLDTEARTDQLTGLASRLDFAERLDTDIAAWQHDLGASETTRPVTLGYLDIDRFKQINDEYGHHVGDELLRQSADRLMAAATETEMVARLGGDELTVISSVDAHSLGVRVLGCFDEPFEIEGRRLPVNVSVGVAQATGETSSEELMRNADAALYAAKDAGGSRHVVFGASLKLHTEQRMTLESELQIALVNGEIVPWLQPIVDLETGEIVAAEALARWQHADGLRNAASFIDAIRQVGMMAEYTEQLIKAVQDFRSSVEVPGSTPLPISINVPCSHLGQLVDVEGVAPLIIEVTEETAIDEISDTRKLLQDLRRAGHQIWLDDFGTGFSSMAVAAQLPIDGVKVDREFVSELLSSHAVRGVVAAMVELGDRLSVDVVAEGVEDHAQAQMLRTFGIEMAQGHLWSPAVPFTDFAEWLRAQHRFVVHASRDRSGTSRS